MPCKLPVVNGVNERLPGVPTLRHLAAAYGLAGLVAGTLACTARAEPDGALLFEQKCTACHTIGGGVRVGPDLQGVTQRRPEEWILRFIREPDRMLAEGDPVAMALFEKFNRIPMANMGLSELEALAIVEHLRRADATAASDGVASTVSTAPASVPPLARRSIALLGGLLAATVAIALVFAAVAATTRRPGAVDTGRGYALRRTLFTGAVVVALAVLVLTLPNVPYAAPGARADRVVYVTARQFEFVYTTEPVASAEDLSHVPALQRLAVPAGELVEFRVTSLDVNHGFGVYGLDRQLLAQTQAMPGYVNRLRVRFEQPGRYDVLCLEYCAAAHHFMRSGFDVLVAADGGRTE